MHIKPTKEQFQDFVNIRDSGVTNMYDVNRVCSLSTTGLVWENCTYIMHDNNFEKLAKEYGVKI